MAGRNDEFYDHYQAGTLDVHDYVRFATEAVRLRGPEAAAAAHAQFMREVIAPAIRPQALDLIRQHQAAGDEVLIVTATNEFVTRPIAKALGVEELLAVRTGARCARLVHRRNSTAYPPCAEGKVRRMEQWLAERQLGWADVEGTFYSDSMNDVPLLEKVNHPVATNPDPRLRALAQERGWRILDLFHAKHTLFIPMIKKFIDKLLGKDAPGPLAASRPLASARRCRPRCTASTPSWWTARAADVVRTLKDAGYEAYIVGGAVRDLLLGLHPKDFDVATNATP